MSASLTTATPLPAVLSTEQVDTITNLVLAGDLSKMDNAARVRYYVQLCESLSLNPYTQPFQILKFQGKEILYVTKSCTEQLRKLWGVSVTKLEHRQEGDVYLVVAYVVDSTGRTDAGTGAVQVTNLKGEALANAFMKAETKAKRRATLSICGLGMLDESEMDTMPQAVKVTLPAAQEIGTSAELVAPATPASPAPAATVAGLSARTRKLLQLAMEAYDADVKGGAGYEQRLVTAIETMSQAEGEKILAWLEKQPKKKPAKQPAKATVPVGAGNADLVQEFYDQPTVGMNEPLASEKQTKELRTLLGLRPITEAESAKLLLVLYKLDEVRAGQAIFKLLNTIAEREGQDADKDFRVALHRFAVNYAQQLGTEEADRLRLVADDKSLHWQQVRAELLLAKEGLTAVPA